MRRTPLAALLPALLVVLALALSGCGGTEKKDTSIGQLGDDAPGESPRASSTPSAGSATAGFEESRPFDAAGNEAIRGRVRATTPEEHAVAQAWFAYWDVRVGSYFKAKVDPKLGAVAAGPAASEVVRYVAYLRGRKLHTVGDTRFGVADVKVRGTSATLTSCGVNKSLDRSADGEPAEQLAPFYNFEGTVTKVGGTWRVVEASVVAKEPCTA